MPKLNQIIAIAAGKKTQAHKSITDVYQSLQKTALLEGISRTYKPKDDEGEQLPAEKKLVQLKVAAASPIPRRAFALSTVTSRRCEARRAPLCSQAGLEHRSANRM